MANIFDLPNQAASYLGNKAYQYGSPLLDRLSNRGLQSPDITDMLTTMYAGRTPEDLLRGGAGAVTGGALGSLGRLAGGVGNLLDAPRQAVANLGDYTIGENEPSNKTGLGDATRLLPALLAAAGGVGGNLLAPGLGALPGMFAGSVLGQQIAPEASSSEQVANRLFSGLPNEAAASTPSNRASQLASMGLAVLMDPLTYMGGGLGTTIGRTLGLNSERAATKAGAEALKQGENSLVPIAELSGKINTPISNVASSVSRSTTPEEAHRMLSEVSRESTHDYSVINDPLYSHFFGKDYGMPNDMRPPMTPGMLSELAGTERLNNPEARKILQSFMELLKGDPGLENIDPAELMRMTKPEQLAYKAMRSNVGGPGPRAGRYLAGGGMQ